jgi:hypothetical protein
MTGTRYAKDCRSGAPRLTMRSATADSIEPVKTQLTLRVVVDIHHDTETPELVHWHGQMIHCHQQLHMNFGFMALFDYA